MVILNEYFYFVGLVFFLYASYNLSIRRWRNRLYKGQKIGRFRVISRERSTYLLSDGNTDVYCAQKKLFPWGIKVKS